jgi:DNA repair protein RecO (recombination protein O)
VKSYRDRGVVLRTWPLGESDRIALLVTEAHGKLRAVAKGARGRRSRFSGIIQPSMELDLLLWRGRELDVIQQAALRDAPGGGRLTPEAFLAMSEWLEAVDLVTLERAPDARVYRLVADGREAVVAHEPSLAVGTLILQLLWLEGFAPSLARCGRCGAPEGLVRFDFASQTARCGSCPGESVGWATLVAARAVLEGRGGEVLALADHQLGRSLSGFALRLVAAVAGRSTKTSSVWAGLDA